MWCFKIYPALVWNSNKYFLTPSKFLSCGMWRPTFEARGGNLGMGRELQLWHSSSLHLWTLWKLPATRWIIVWVSCLIMHLGQDLVSCRLGALRSHILPVGSLSPKRHWPCAPARQREPYNPRVWVHHLWCDTSSKNELPWGFLRRRRSDNVGGGKISLGKQKSSWNCFPGLWQKRSFPCTGWPRWSNDPDDDDDDVG